MDGSAAAKHTHGHGHGIGEFREAAKGRTSGRCYHQRRAPRVIAHVHAETMPLGLADVLAVIRRITRDRSRMAAVYLSPAGAVHVVAEDLSVSHQRWAREHHDWLVGWYTHRATIEDLEASL